MRTAALLGALYAVVVLVSPALHHDVACHRTTPTHCTACTSSLAAPRAEQPSSFDLPRLPDAGQVQGLGPRLVEAGAPVLIPARAPPA